MLVKALEGMCGNDCEMIHKMLDMLYGQHSKVEGMVIPQQVVIWRSNERARKLAESQTKLETRQAKWQDIPSSRKYLGSRPSQLVGPEWLACSSHTSGQEHHGQLHDNNSAHSAWGDALTFNNSSLVGLALSFLLWSTACLNPAPVMIASGISEMICEGSNREVVGVEAGGGGLEGT